MNVGACLGNAKRDCLPIVPPLARGGEIEFRLVYERGRLARQCAEAIRLVRPKSGSRRGRRTGVQATPEHSRRGKMAGFHGHNTCQGQPIADPQ